MGHDISLIKGHPHLTSIWKDVVVNQCHVTEGKHAVCNYFMVRPIQMQAYLGIFQRVLWPGIDKNPKSHENSMYAAGKVAADRLRLLTGKP
jgi:hypothetical protein